MKLSEYETIIEIDCYDGKKTFKAVQPNATQVKCESCAFHKSPYDIYCWDAPCEGYLREDGQGVYFELIENLPEVPKVETVPLGSLTEIFDEVSYMLYSDHPIDEDVCIKTDRGQVTLKLREVLQVDPVLFDIVVRKKFVKKES